MAIDPNFANAPKTSSTSFTTANANLNGTGAIQTILTAPTGGALIQRIRIKATVSTTAGMLRLFHSATGAANSWFLLDEEAVDAITIGATTKSFVWLKIFEGEGFVLEAGHYLGVSTQIGELFHVTAEWASMQ